MNICNTCQCELDEPGAPLSMDCGGDCVECMAVAGDPEAKLYVYTHLFTRLVNEAESKGVIVTVERVPLQPLAMRNHAPKIETRLAR